MTMIPATVFVMAVGAVMAAVVIGFAVAALADVVRHWR